MKIESNIIFDLYNKMTKQKIISAYHGVFSQQVINMLLKQAKWDMNNRNMDRRIQKKTYNILVECLENILKHASNQEEGSLIGESDGIVVFGSNVDKYYITVGNLIYTTEVPKLKAKLDAVNALDKDGLKQYYKDKLINAQISERGGAGVGLIDIAMKSGSQLDYHFQDHTDKISFFALQVNVSANS